MVVLIAVLALGVVYLAVKSPDPNQANKETLQPNNNVPMLGTVGNPSPAMSGGSPVASQVYRTALAVNSSIVGDIGLKLSAGTSVKQLASPAGTFVPTSTTVAEMGKMLMTQALPPTPTTSTTPTFKVIKI
jgi:hypothetical protein